MNDYMPLLDDVLSPLMTTGWPITVTEESVTRNVRQISIAKASGPNYHPNRVFKEYADILAPAVTDIINTS